MKLQEDLAAIQAAGVRVVGISYDSEETLQKFAQKAGITFPLLSDTNSQVIDAFGLRNQSVASGSKKEGIPHPGTVIIDAEGHVCGKLFYSIRHRHSSAELIDAVQEKQPDAPQPSTSDP